MNTAIIEGNKLIAAFMSGGKIKRSAGGARLYYVMGSTYRIDMLQYNTSWDWLMTVFEEINIKCTGYDIIIFRTTTHVNYKLQILIETTNSKSMITHVFDAVVRFVKYWNENENPLTTLK